MLIHKSILKYIVSAVFLITLTAILFYVEQDHIVSIILGVAVLGICQWYFFTSFNEERSSDRNILWSVGIIARFIAVMAFPLLSDDIYRFYWDGQLWLQGLNPYHHIPAEMLQKNMVPGELVSVYDQLNSPQYYTVYPPTSQFFYVIGALLSSSIYQFSIVLGVLLMLFDILSMRILWSWFSTDKKSMRYAVWYFLSPLVIIEGIGNLHFEVVMLSLLLVAIHYTFKPLRPLRAGLAIAGSVMTKLHSLISVPFLFLAQPLIWKRLVKTIGAALVYAVFCFWLMFYYRGSDAGIWTSLDLYFQKFEFNASIYYVAREIGFWIYGYNKIAWIGPVLSSTAAVIIFLLIMNYYKRHAFKGQIFSVLFYSMVALCVYFFFATTVHPWYLILPLGLGIILKQRWVICWSFVIFFSYARYVSDAETALYYGLITVEYVLVILAILVTYKKDIRPYF